MKSARNLNVLIAMDDTTTSEKIQSNFAKTENFEKILTTQNGNECLKILENEQIDILISDIILEEIDGFEVLQKLKSLNANPKILICSPLTTQQFITKALSLGADYYMKNPVDINLLTSRVLDLVNTNDSVFPTTKQKSMDEKISNIFITVGIPAHIKGYYFLREAVKMAINNPTIINSITKILYPSIAEIFETSASKVERAIRHAIEVAWNRGKIENINDVFGIKVYSNTEKPTNGEFIALVADKMLLEA